MTNRNEHLLDVLRVLFKHKKLIRNISVATCIVSLIVCMLLPNYYKATTIFYPASPELANPEQMFGNTGNITNYFGNEHDLDRLLEIANSEELARFMIDTFNLYSVYEIDSTDTDAAFDVRKKFRKLYSVEKNRFDAIEVSIEDKDRTRCAPMINVAREKINQMAQQLTKESQQKLLNAFEKNMADKESTIERLNDSLELIKNQYGIYDVGTQGSQLSYQATLAKSQVVQLRAILATLEPNPIIPRDTIAFIKARLSGYEQQLRSLKSDDAESASSFNEGSQVVMVLQDLHFQARKQLSYDIERYNQIKATFQTSIPALHVIQPGEAPLRKSRPTRSLIVIVSTLAAAIFTCLGLLLRASFREVTWKSLHSAD